jgi:hypothetical protein
MPAFFPLITLNLPLLAEVVRKYLILNDFVFLSADIIAVIALLSIVSKGKVARLPGMFIALSFVFVFYTLTLQLFSESNFGIYGIGVRACYMPIVYLLLSAHFFETNPNAIRMLFASATFWIIVSALMAAAQLALGRNHPINNVWGQQGVGIGDYLGEGGALIDRSLFRPTSIFMHTGKFGQVVFVLVLFRMCYVFKNAKSINKMLFITFAFDLVALFISGQRGAFLFIAICLVFLILNGARDGVRTSFKIFLSLVLLSLLIGAIVTVLPEYGSAFVERFNSTIGAIPRRIQGNLIEPFETISSRFMFDGRGFGYYTFGSKVFGGTVVYRDPQLTLEGYGESSIVRMCLETGLVAAAVNLAAYMVLFVKAVSAYRSSKSSGLRASVIFYLLWIASLSMWSNTADVFGNTVPIFFGYALSGAIVVRAQVAAPRSSIARISPFAALMK